MISLPPRLPYLATAHSPTRRTCVFPSVAGDCSFAGSLVSVRPYMSVTGICYYFECTKGSWPAPRANQGLYMNQKPADGGRASQLLHSDTRNVMPWHIISHHVLIRGWLLTASNTSVHSVFSQPHTNSSGVGKANCLFAVLQVS